MVNYQDLEARPTKKMHYLQLRIPRGHFVAFRRKAQENGWSMNKTVNKLIYDWLMGRIKLEDEGMNK